MIWEKNQSLFTWQPSSHVSIGTSTNWDLRPNRLIQYIQSCSPPFGRGTWLYNITDNQAMQVLWIFSCPTSWRAIPLIFSLKNWFILPEWLGTYWEILRTLQSPFFFSSAPFSSSHSPISILPFLLQLTPPLGRLQKKAGLSGIRFILGVNNTILTF